jgi:hypothetical protein
MALLVNKKDFQLLGAYSKPWYSSDKDRKNRLGVLKKCTFKKKEGVLCRVIDFDRITTY